MHGLARALREQLDHVESYAHLAHKDRVAILVDREWAERESRSLTRRLQLARLRDRTACVEDVDFQHPRGLDRTLIRRLAACEWIQKRQNLIITGPGKRISPPPSATKRAARGTPSSTIVRPHRCSLESFARSRRFPMVESYSVMQYTIVPW